MRLSCVLLVLAFAAAAGADEDPRVRRFRQFLRDNIEGYWGSDELPENRAVMVRGFDKHDCPDAALWLMTKVFMTDQSGIVVREAVRVLSRFKSPNTVMEMVSIYQKKYRKDWRARVYAQCCFGNIKIDDADGPVSEGLKDKDPRVAAAACDAVAIGRRIAFKGDLVKLLSHKHRAVRGAAALALAELRAHDAMPAVFNVFCGDASQRVRYDAWLALKKLSLEKLPCDPKAWEPWWETQAGAIVEEGEVNPWGTEFPKLARNAGKAGYFFRIPVLADRVGFVLDVSMSLEGAWKIDHRSERKKKPEDRIPNFFGVKTRWDLVRNNVDACLAGMPEDVEVAFVCFSHEIFPWPDKGRLMVNKPRYRSKISAYLKDDVKRSGGSAIYEGFQGGWGFVRNGDPKHNFERGADTLVFVTDSQVRDGEMKNKPDRLRDEVWRMAVTRRLRIHVVGIHNHDYALCQSLAKDSGGLYVHAQQHDDQAEPQDLDFWPEKKKAWEAKKRKNRR